MSEDAIVDIVEPSNLEKEVDDPKAHTRRDLEGEIGLSNECEIDEVQEGLKAEELDYDPVSDDEGAKSAHVVEEISEEAPCEVCEEILGEGVEGAQEEPKSEPQESHKGEQVEVIEIQDDRDVIDLVGDADEDAMQLEVDAEEPEIERSEEPEVPVIKTIEEFEVTEEPKEHEANSLQEPVGVKTGQELEQSQSPLSHDNASDASDVSGSSAIDLDTIGEYLGIPVSVQLNGSTPLWEPSSPRRILAGPPAADLSLDSLFTAIRDYFDVETDVEIILLIPQLDLEVGEDNLYCNDTTLLDLLRLLDTCKEASSLELTVELRPRFISKLNALFDKLNDLPPAKKPRLLQ